MKPDDKRRLENLIPEVRFDTLPATKQYEARPLRRPDADSENDELGLRGLWRIARKRWWLVAGLTVIVTAVVTIQMFRTKPLYEATARIEIGRDSGTRVASSEVFTRDDEDLIVTMNTSEVVLRSEPLLEDVAAQLKLDQTPAFMDVVSRRSFSEALRNIAAEFDIGGMPEQRPSAVPIAFPMASDKPKGEKKRPQAEVESLAPYVGILANSLVVRPIRDTRIMTIAFRHTDPAIAANVANTVAARFVETSFDKKLENFASASEWLDRSTRELKAKIQLAEQALADYTKKNNIYAFDSKETLITEKLSRLHDQASRAETDRILKGSLYQQMLKGGISEIPEAFSDPHVKELQKKLGELTTTAGVLDTTFTPKYSKVIETNAEIAAIREQLSASLISLGEKLHADYETAVLNEEALNAALERAKTAASQENQTAIQYSFLKQDVETSKSLYAEFLQNTNQADLQVAQQHSNIRVISTAPMPRSPVGPNRPRSITIALLMSLAGGMGLAWLLERFDDSIRNVGDVARFTPVPAIGVIPVISAGGRLWSGRKPREIHTNTLGIGSDDRPSRNIQRARLMEFDGSSLAAEAYRGLRTSLLFSTNGDSPKTILVTSARPEEGKTTTAANIAISLAQLGTSVVLLDCDLRKPSIHDVFGMTNTVGLSTYLSCKGEWESVIQDVPEKNLQLIPAGPAARNPAELLSSERMKQLLLHLAKRFEHIVIDSPPLGSVTDPVILSTIVDGVILVVHGGRNSRYGVQRACSDLSAVGARIIGIVLNNVDMRRQGYDNYYYSSQSYGYPRDDRHSKN